MFEVYSEAEPKINYESVGYKIFAKEEIKLAPKENPKLFGDAFHFVVKTFYPNLLEQ